MSSELQNLSSFNISEIPSAKGMKIGIVVSEWNPKITIALLHAAKDTLIRCGCSESDISTSFVPGSYELILGAQWMHDQVNPDAVICLGCVIQGETRHFDFICEAVAQGLKDLNLKFSKPFIFGVLTPDNMEQAIARAGGKHGNKGIEAAITAIKMIALKRKNATAY